MYLLLSKTLCTKHCSWPERFGWNSSIRDLPNAPFRATYWARLPHLPLPGKTCQALQPKAMWDLRVSDKIPGWCQLSHQLQLEPYRPWIPISHSSEMGALWCTWQWEILNTSKRAQNNSFVINTNTGFQIFNESRGQPFTPAILH